MIIQVQNVHKYTFLFFASLCSIIHADLIKNISIAFCGIKTEVDFKDRQ